MLVLSCDLKLVRLSAVPDFVVSWHVKIVRRVANKSVTSWQQVCCVVVMEFGKRRYRTDTTDFWSRQLVTDLLRGNWCNGFWL